MEKKETRIKKTPKPWPTKEAMEQVYAMKLWGDNNSDFYSGDGSHDLELVTPYIEVLRAFLTSFKSPLIVCDLGCGDFNIGNQLVKLTKKYLAVDIVKDLITHNKETFREENLEFKYLDIALGDLPSGDCAILRQVLQHLSNAEILSILSKLVSYKYVVITEHIPKGYFTPNIDIISGQGIRIKKQSGVDLLARPFNFKIKEAKQVLSIPLNGSKGVIVTTIYTVF